MSTLGRKFSKSKTNYTLKSIQIINIFHFYMHYYGPQIKNMKVPKFGRSGSPTMCVSESTQTINTKKINYLAEYRS